MKNKVFILFLFLFSISITAQQHLEVNYYIKPIPKGDRTNLEIEVDFKSEKDSLVPISLPSGCGAKDYTENIIKFTAKKGTSIDESSTNGKKLLLPNSSGVVSFKYILSVDPEKATGYFPAITNEEYFSLMGCQWALFIGSSEDIFDYHISIEPIENWEMQSNLSSNPEKIVVKDAHYWQLGGGFDARISGTKKSFTKDINGEPVTVFINGNYNIPAKVLSERAMKIIELEREWFQDYDFPFFYVTLNQNDGSLSGMALQNQFNMFGPKDLKMDEFSYLLAHEIMHQWIGNVIKIYETEDDPFIKFNWFTEGFTEYMAIRLLLENDLITEDDFKIKINENLKNLALNPYKNITYEDLVDEKKGIQRDYLAQKLGYQRGFLIAYKWDKLIQAQGSNQDLKDMIDDILAFAKNNEKDYITADEFYELTKSYNIDGYDYFKKYVLNGETIDFSTLISKKYTTKTVMMNSYDLGFNINYSGETKRIEKIQEDSPAYKAGLRNGIQLLNISYLRPFSYSNPVTVEIENNSGEKEKIEFTPRGEEIEVLQIQ